MRSPDSESSAIEGRPLVGDVVAGKYRIESVAGEGGMGIVYEAEHVILRQRVALKVLHPDAITSADAVDRFSVEAAAIARIASEHVVRIMDAGSLPSGAPYLVMEYLEGCDLEQLLSRRGPLPEPEVVDFVLQALEGLAHAHAAHAIHRDLKPANLFLAKLPDGREVIKLVDFGIVQSTELGADKAAGRVLGSPMYMSPEHLTNAQVDARSDLWSLGVVVYELLVGSPPFTGNFSEIVTGIRHGTPAFFTKPEPSLSPALARIIQKCLARDRDDRWSSCAELARAVAPHGSGKWTGAVERVENALHQSAPMVAPRKFASLENALQALDSDWRSHESFGATIPAPSANDRVTALPACSKPAPLRILHIDDSAIALEAHRHQLVDAGFDARTTSSVAEFDMLLESWKPHLVLMAVQMPGVSGEELCKRVKAKFRATVPVVFVSNLDPAKLEEVTRSAGADAFFEKTPDAHSFVDFVKNICSLAYSPEALPDADLDDR